uniref:Uncharacterized protein n=1 Tax=Oryza glumipatula TaxID=40148 RepID=A0A0E0A818_9ORYZ
MRLGGFRKWACGTWAKKAPLNPTPLSQIDPPNLAPCERLAIVATTAKQAATTTSVAGARSGSNNLWSDDGEELNTSPLSAREDPIAAVMARSIFLRLLPARVSLSSSSPSPVVAGRGVLKLALDT